jgi:hypothetical protein
VTARIYRAAIVATSVVIIGIDSGKDLAGGTQCANAEGRLQLDEAAMTDERRTDHDSADQKAHGTHGKGMGNEQREDEANVEPDIAYDTEGEGARGDAGWGSAGSGGSVIDKRPDKSKG